MLLLRRRTVHRRRKRVLLLLAAISAGALWLGYEPVRLAYQRHRHEKTMRRARAYVQAGDLRNARLAVEVATRSEGHDSDSLRITADICELENSPQALTLREELVRLNPRSDADRLAAVRTALRFAQVEVAERLFADASDAGKNSADGLRVQAALHLHTRQPKLAEQTLEKLVSGGAAEPEIEFELAVLQLQDPDRPRREAARGRLQMLARRHAAIEPLALRELLRDAAQRGAGGEARELADRLVARPDAPFDDHIRRLNVLHRWPGLTRERILNATRSRAAGNARDAAQLALWFIATARTRDAIAWVDALPDTITATAEMRSARASVFAAAKDWDRLLAEIEAGAWGDVQRETVRSAMHVRALHAAGQVDEVRKRWRNILSVNAGRLPDLAALARLAALWGLPDEQSAALRAIADSTPNATWALERLAMHCHGRGDTRALADTLALWLKRNPKDGRIKSDWLLAASLCGRGVPPPELVREAAALQASEPDNPYFTTCHAYLLWRTGELDRSLALMAALRPAALAHPTRALYYGAMLAAAGQCAAAAPHLASARRARLLPEEARMLEDALAAVSRAGVEIPDVSDMAPRSGPGRRASPH